MRAKRFPFPVQDWHKGHRFAVNQWLSPGQGKVKARAKVLMNQRLNANQIGRQSKEMTKEWEASICWHSITDYFFLTSFYFSKIRPLINKLIKNRNLRPDQEKLKRRERSIFSVISQIIMAGNPQKREKEIRTRPYKFVDEQKIWRGPVLSFSFFFLGQA